jgi:pimeloyl-ACP methyl ester carboxylesterase
MTSPAAGYPSRMVDAGSTQCGPFRVAWTETGPADAPRVLLLHGLYAGAHSYEWRALAPVLSSSFRVRVPDLLGAGDSDRPDLEYTRSIVQSVVDALISDSGSDTIVVASSLTGAYALRSVATGTPVSSLVLLTPTGLGHLREGRPNAFANTVYDLARHTPIGDLFVAALTSGPSVRWFQTHKTYRDPSVFNRGELDATRRAGRLPNAKHLQLAFVFGRLALDVTPEDVRRVAPTVIWGCGQDFVDNEERHRWSEAGAPVVDAPSGLPQVEEPDNVAAIVRELVSS